MNVTHLLAFLLSYFDTSVTFLSIAHEIHSKLSRSHWIHLYQHSIIHCFYLDFFIWSCTVFNLDNIWSSEYHLSFNVHHHLHQYWWVWEVLYAILIESFLNMIAVALSWTSNADASCWLIDEDDRRFSLWQWFDTILVVCLLNLCMISWFWRFWRIVKFSSLLHRWCLVYVY